MNTCYKKVVSRIAEGKHKAYLEVDGKPFLYNAVQTWCQPDEDFSIYLEKAAEVNYRIISIWLHWRCLEPEEGKYDMSRLDMLISQAEKFDLRLDIIWGGSDFCGHLDPRFAPDWVLNRHEYHLKDRGKKCLVVPAGDFEYCHAVDCRNPDILEKEKKMISVLLKHLEEFDTTHRVVFFQVGNEVNMNDWTGNKKGSVLYYWNEIAGVFKTSEYGIATRMNLWGRFNDIDVERLPNIDCHGPDPYSSDIRVIRDVIYDRERSLMPYIAENSAYPNTTSLLVAALAGGGFYHIYMLAYDRIWNNPGIYDDNWVYNDLTFRLKNFNLALNRIGSIVTTAPRFKMQEFNTETSTPTCGYCARKYLGEKVIGMDCGAEGTAVGLVVEDSGFLYFVADGNAVFFLEENPLNCESGELDNEGNWLVSSNKKVFARSQGTFGFRYEAGECIRIKI